MKYTWIKVSLILALSCSEEPIEERLEYKEAFWQLREECFTKWGVLLFYPSECNDPDYLRMLADSLRLAGIDINSP